MTKLNNGSAVETTSAGANAQSERPSLEEFSPRKLKFKERGSNNVPATKESRAGQRHHSLVVPPSISIVEASGVGNGSIPLSQSADNIEFAKVGY